MEIEGHHSEAEVSMDKIIGEDHIMLILIEVVLGKTVLEEQKITKVKITTLC